MKKIALHWQILTGMFLGLLFGFVLLSISWGSEMIVVDTIEAKDIIVQKIMNGEVVTKAVHVGEKEVKISKARHLVSRWIEPFGVIFINLLKLIAIPLILASLIKGISDLKDISKFRSMGLKTIGIYIGTTVIAIVIGLVLVNTLEPGGGVSQETIEQVKSTYADSESIKSKIDQAGEQKSSGPLQFIVDMVPDNAFKAMSSNGLMLQAIVFAIFLGMLFLKW